ncbi:bifunctional 4-hydroxy-2-oxoglutarate aldolase/2-dehydro-3-deoxy-phosphogluconate aldolase [Terrabacter sp. GCM10028922]|uniref:bifunctional 4-hydroxy-2-oxoglutarate aldolase/2-dehydro-3-deoxy-phosphogluconate aldolase n=1 Tax=Terrabacter sp. GCM10028922 TaxID=3273428 RepID=UPI0036244DEE
MVTTSRPKVFEDHARSPLLAIVRGHAPDAARDTVETLLDEGVSLLEVSLTSTDALQVIADAAAHAPSTARVGAGTVLTADDARASADAGATFLVTPGLCAGAETGIALGLPVLVGALTPSEVIAAVRMGASAVKLFPAGLGGPGYLRALRAPFPDVPFVPVGEVDLQTALEYLDSGAVAVGVGSPLVGDAADGGSLEQLRSRVRAYVAALEQLRSSRPVAG